MDVSLEQVRELIGELVTDHWLKALGGAALILLGRVWGKRRAHRDWRAKRFMHRVVVSLACTRRTRLVRVLVLSPELPVLALRLWLLHVETTRPMPEHLTQRWLCLGPSQLDATLAKPRPASPPALRSARN